MNYQQQGQYPGMSPYLPKFAPGYPPQSISPTQLIAPHPHQIPAQPLTLTPAQLLQQQQFPLMPPPVQQNPPVRIPFQPPRYLHRPPDRPPGTPTHDRPPSQHAHRQPSQPHDIHDRPDSSSSVRHDLHSRPATASGPPRHPMHLANMNMAQPQMVATPMGIPMNRPPTRTDSALGHASPKQSPRMSMGTISNSLAAGLGPNMAGATMANLAAMNPNMVMGMGMNAPVPGGGNMMGGAFMVPPQAMQRPDREPMMQPHMREQSVPVSRETVRMVAPLPDHPHGMPQSLAPTSTPFMGLDNTANMPRQSSQPPPQQSPARQVPPPHRSPMPPTRKIGEIPAPAPTPPVNVPPIPGTTPGQKLPPHIASLNPAVTKISYLPYVVPPKPSDADATDDEDKKPDEPTTETDKDAAETKIEDPLPRLVPCDIATLRDVMVRDSAYDIVYRAKKARMLQELRTAGPGGRMAWWDRDFAASVGINRRPDRFDVRYPRPPRTDGSMAPRKKGARREGIRMSVPFLSLSTAKLSLSIDRGNCPPSWRTGLSSSCRSDSSLTWSTTRCARRLSGI